MHTFTLQDLAEKDIITKILETFNYATDLTAVIVDLEGNPVLLPDDQLQTCEFCRIIRQNRESRKRCSEAYARAGKLAATICEPYIFRCPAGLIEWAAPILYKKQHLGTIICGRVLMWDPEDFFWVELTLMNRELDLDMVKLIAAAEKLPVVSGKKVQAAADLLFAMTNHIVETGFMSLNQQRTLKKQNQLLEEEMNTRKMLELALKPFDSFTDGLTYSRQKEAQLLASIKLGDKPRALGLLNEFVEELRDQCAGELQTLKAKAQELLVMVSRAAIERGAAPKNLLELNYCYTEELFKLESSGEILAWIPLIVEQYMDMGGDQRQKNYRVARQVMEYIKKNLNRNLSLEDIAQAVYLSPFYLSRVFKEETGCTVMEYLTRTRMEEAKKLLAEGQISVREIAEKVGYHNPSYFSKVFHAAEGLTPSQFRRRYLV